MATPRQPLSHIRVLDFGRYIAGPYAATLLADFGADVIRIERPGGGEDRFIYPVTTTGEGALLLQMGRNKRGLTLDLKSPHGRDILRRLVQSADVVVANLPQQTLADLGLDYETLSALNPAIILAASAAFGEGGPYVERVGFDAIGQAMSGAGFLSGPPGHPMKSFASWVDYTTGLLSAYGIMAALMARGDGGHGQEVRTDLFASAINVMNFALIEQDLTAINRESTGNRAQSGGPADFFQTTDGWIAVQVIGAPLFRRWATMIGELQWLDDPRFASDSQRAEHGAVLSQRTAGWCRSLTQAAALEALAQARIPAGPVLSPAAVLEDPQVNQAGMLTEMDYPGAPKPARLMMSAVRLSETPSTLRRRAPLAGEHTDEILASLGYAPDIIAKLRDAGVI